MRKLTENNIAVIGSFIILTGIFFLSYNYVQAKRLIAYEYMDNLFYEEANKKEKPSEKKEEKEPEQQEKTEKIPQEENSEPKPKSVPNAQRNYQYVGYLEIPKINLRKGIVDKNSKDNNVEKNLFIASSSTYPDIEQGNLIIAGHSGSGYKAFFKKLYQIGMGDIAKVEYNGKVYTYQVTKIYEHKKTGKIAIHRDYTKTTLTLITCTKDSEDKQTIYILNLINVE